MTTRIGLFHGGSGLSVEFDETEAGERIVIEVDDHTASVPIGILREVLDAAGIGMETSA
jgi:hypothetical protein